MLSPEHRINSALIELSEGVADLRAKIEQTNVEQAQRRAVLVDAETRLYSTRSQLAQTRRPRHLSPVELSGPRRPARDTQPVASVRVDRVVNGESIPGTRTEVTPVGATEQRSLDLMGLSPPIRKQQTPESTEERTEASYKEFFRRQLRVLRDA